MWWFRDGGVCVYLGQNAQGTAVSLLNVSA